MKLLQLQEEKCVQPDGVSVSKVRWTIFSDVVLVWCFSPDDRAVLSSGLYVRLETLSVCGKSDGNEFDGVCLEISSRLM